MYDVMMYDVCLEEAHSTSTGTEHRAQTQPGYKLHFYVRVDRDDTLHFSFPSLLHIKIKE